MDPLTVGLIGGGFKLIGGWLNRKKAKKHAAAMQAAFERERLRQGVDSARQVGYNIPIGASREQLNEMLNSQGPRTWLPGYGAQDERRMFGDITDNYEKAQGLQEEYRPIQEQGSEYAASLAGPQRVQQLKDLESGVQSAMTDQVEGNIAASDEALTGQLQAMNSQASDQNFRNMQSRYGGQNVGGAGFMNRMAGTRQNLFGNAANARAENAVQGAEARGNLGVNMAQRNQQFEQNVLPGNQLNAYGNVFSDKDYRTSDMFAPFGHASPKLNMFAPGRTPVAPEKIFQKPFLGSGAGNLLSGLGDMGMAMAQPSMAAFGKGMAGKVTDYFGGGGKIDPNAHGLGGGNR